jgi:ABC-type lipopolysaccharide export system ATPase subunit
MTALRFVGITKRYGVRTILDDVSLCAESAGIVALAGVNGSGKSTLYRIAAGFVREEAGRVFMDRASETLDLSALAPTERVRSGLRYVPQDRRVVCDLSTVETLRLAANDCDDIFDVVAELRLGALFQKRPSQMTAAERGLLLLTIVRAARPAFVIVDEPFAGLDRLQRWHCIAILRHLSESGMGVAHRPRWPDSARCRNHRSHHRAWPHRLLRRREVRSLIAGSKAALFPCAWLGRWRATSR